MPKRSAQRPSIFDNPQLIALPAELHPLVAAWMEWERQNEEAARRENRETWPKEEDTYMGRRRLRIRHALFKAAEARGYRLEHPETPPAPVSIRIKDRLVEWSLEDQGTTHYIPLPKKELKKRENVERGVTAELMYVPTGTFKLAAATGGTKTRISERPHKPFERRIDEVLRRFEKLVDDAIAADIRFAEGVREYEEQIKSIERPRRLRVMENARWNRLREQTENWHEARSLHAFINAVERSLGKGKQPGRTTAWLNWARERADELDPLLNGKASAREITQWRYYPKTSEYELSVWELPY